MNNLLFVFIGGGIGSVLRYLVSLLVKSKYENVFPLATLLSNVFSCIILGVVVGLFSQKIDAQPSLKLFLLVGVCGGFSTFSTFGYETVELFRQGNALFALLNILVSTILCTGIVYLLIRNNSGI